ncbi:MarR family winged helix-turn-helix transcriptional regulator [Paenibacillus sp. CN-4]|uniref:MarR family winged helix-turn-helix transcriptional regulator n=1 Tax=Paenibacillus nanchangensis TaxID=3348343 RepID=UPI00397A9C0C
MSGDSREALIIEVMNQMAAVQRSSQAFSERITKRSSLTQNQTMLLMQLRLSGSLNVSDVAERFIITPGAASSMCDKLEDLGLVQRLRTKEDRRVVRIALTAEGESRVADLFDTFGEEQLARTAQALAKVQELMAGVLE